MEAKEFHERKLDELSAMLLEEESIETGEETGEIEIDEETDDIDEARKKGGERNEGFNEDTNPGMQHEEL